MSDVVQQHAWDNDGLRRELTWSRKWHIVASEEASPTGRYLFALCGAYLEYEGGSLAGYPEHLRDIKQGRRKGTGDCKICAKMSGSLTPEQLLQAEVDRLRADVERLTPRRIETVEQLDAIGQFAVVQDRFGSVWEKEDHGTPETPWSRICDEKGYAHSAIRLPAVVLFTPDAAS